MIIQYSDDLTKQTYAEDVEVLRKAGVHGSFPNEGYIVLGVVDNPVAALDRYALGKLQNGELINALFGSDKVPNVTVYDGMSNHWLRNPGTWPCTIDTMVHLRGQAESGALEKATSVLDFGCGNGPAGIYAAIKNKGIKSMTLSDVNPDAVTTAQMNVMVNYDGDSRGNESQEFRYVVSDAFEAFPRQVVGKQDVILASAMPATPPHPNLNRPLNPLFEGTKVLEELLSNAPNYLKDGGKLIVSHSSVGEKDFERLAKKHGARVDRVLYERDVAFRTEFLNDEQWVRFLEEQGGLFKREGDGFPYGHKVMVKEVHFN